MNQPIGAHYQLSCFVCGRGCTKASPFEGWATFAQIFNARPDGCRYAVARVVPLVVNWSMRRPTTVSNAAEPAGDFIAWDLYDDSLMSGFNFAGQGGTWITPPPVLWRSEHEDGLVMKCMALYERTG